MGIAGVEREEAEGLYFRCSARLRLVGAHYRGTEPGARWRMRAPLVFEHGLSPRAISLLHLMSTLHYAGPPHTLCGVKVPECLEPPSLLFVSVSNSHP